MKHQSVGNDRRSAVTIKSVIDERNPPQVEESAYAMKSDKSDEKKYVGVGAHDNPFLFDLNKISQGQLDFSRRPCDELSLRLMN